ncbi:hypothetical protein Hypma_008440, partial [Hypsizygus marmoreus]
MHLELIEFLGVYSDDSFSINNEGDITFYPRYNKHLPTGQFKLLSLWDKLGILHKEKKQVSSTLLIIIGIEVDPNAMTLTLPTAKREKLIKELNTFIARNGRRSVRFKLNVWQRLAGYINWVFNVFPLLKPSLNNIYLKLNLIWLRDHLVNASGVQLICAVNWSLDVADFTIYCDACLEGMAFWYPDFNVAFYSAVPSDTPSDLIFFYEALCLISAVHHAAANHSSSFKIVVFTDNSNTINIFNTLHCKPCYNPLLKFVCDILIDTKHQLRVFHVPGESNTVADALSRARFMDALSLVPNLSIKPFHPPAQLLGPSSHHDDDDDELDQVILQPPRQPLGQPARVAWTRERLIRERSLALGQAIDNSTWKNYGSTLNSYLNFVRIHDFPVEPTPDTLSFFTVYMCHQIKPKSVTTYLSGICQQLEPYFPKVREYRLSSLVAKTLSGSQRLLAVPTSRKSALSQDDLVTAIQKMPSAPSHDDLLFISMLLSGFYGLHRLGKLLFSDDIELRDDRKTIKAASVVVSQDGYQYFLPGHKADRFFEGNIVIIRKNDHPSNPLPHFLNYFSSRNCHFPLSAELWLTSTGA